MKLGSLCSGIGAMDLGLEYGLHAKTVWQVETNSYCRDVLTRHWPDATRLNDIHDAGSATLPAVDVLCAGFPCQPASVAGKRKAQKDERWLWPEVARIVGELRPSLCVFENVLGLRTAGMRDVLSDLAALGFDVEWADLSAFELGAPHLRRRIFFVATDPKRVELRQQSGWLERACRAAAASVNRFATEGIAAAHSGSERLQGTGQAKDAAARGHDTPERSDSVGDASDAVRERRHASRGPEEQDGQRVGLPASADPDSLRRLEQSWRVATLRGWPVHRGWRFDSTPRVDDVPPRGLVGSMRRAAGNAVVTACAFVVGRATREAVILNNSSSFVLPQLIAQQSVAPQPEASDG